MLSFPTMAEQAIAEFESATKTVSLATICKRLGASVEKKYPTTTYTFDDDTSVTVQGTGANHRYETHLP